MKIYIQEEPGDEETFAGHAVNQKQALDHIADYFTKKMEKEREQMGIDNDALKALKTLRDWMKET